MPKRFLWLQGALAMVVSLSPPTQAELQTVSYGYNAQRHSHSSASTLFSTATVKTPDVIIEDMALSPMSIVTDLKPIETWIEIFADVSPAVVGPLLNFPNPFRLDNGTSLGYQLSKPMDIELFVYDMQGSRILRKEFEATKTGGAVGYNRVQLTKADFQNIDLAAGVYFYILRYNGKILAKNKMAIIP